MAEEGIAAVAASEATESSPDSSDHKRKLEDLEPQEAPPSETVASSTAPADSSQEDLNEKPEEAEDSAPELKRPRLEPEYDESVVENGHDVEKSDVPAVENADAPEVENPEVDNGEHIEHVEHVEEDTDGAEHPSVENPETEDTPQPSVDNLQPAGDQHSLEGDTQQTADGVPQQGNLSPVQHQPETETETETVSRKMEVPSNKVGVLIGKAGDTIRLLQFNSGAKIQITRDSEADIYSSTRPVELIGTLESINKAEKLIKDVIAEADAGGSPSLVAKGFGTVQASGAVEQIQIQVPNEKVGLIIGKGGETIKNLQTRSGARIQLIPQHLPEGDQSKERTVRVTGDKKQIEIAREMIKEVMSQVVRPSHHSGGYNQQTHHRPRGTNGPPHWGPRAPPSGQPTGYNYQRGMHPSQNPQYQPSAYGGYPPQQPTPRGGFNASWDQRPSGPMQGAPQSGGYDYYGQGGHMADSSASIPVSNALAASAAGAPPSEVNYNYGQPQGQDYGQPMPYSQSGHPQQGYSHGYDDPKYANQVSTQPAYGGHGNPQQGAYSQASSQPRYGPQPYTRPPAYGMPSQGPPQAYGPPRPSQPGDMPYQNPTPATHSYGQTAPSHQQPYPYSSGGPAQQQQPYPYGSATLADGYNQPQSLAATAPSYPQQNVQSVPVYGQPGGQPAQGYGQGGGYGPFSSSQQGYSEQPATGAANYGYQAPADGGYGNAPASAYNAQPSGSGYVQPPSSQPGYEQPMPQAGGYVAVPGGAPPGYVKNVSPQPGYTQYDSTQMYGAHH